MKTLVTDATIRTPFSPAGNLNRRRIPRRAFSRNGAQAASVEMRQPKVVGTLRVPSVFIPTARGACLLLCPYGTRSVPTTLSLRHAERAYYFVPTARGACLLLS